MSLLVPNYSSSSEDEEQRPSNGKTSITSTSTSVGTITTSSTETVLTVQPSKTSPKKKHKIKTTLHLPPAIQQLLESGATIDSDDDDEEIDSNHILRKRHAAVKRRKEETPLNKTSLLSFLPPPKHNSTAKSAPAPVTIPPAASEHSTNGVQDQPTAPVASVSSSGPMLDTSTQYTAPYDTYAVQEQAMYEASQSSSSRPRDRELERLLQQGHFEQVADSIVDVHGPSPDAWEAPPPDPRMDLTSTNVPMYRPSRLQRQRHQLNQLTFDAVTREAELLERKGNAIKTKRETHAKYGW